MRQYVVFFPAALFALLVVGVGVLGLLKPTGQETAPRVKEGAVSRVVGLLVLAALAWLALVAAGGN
ncbi:hypothetical protein KKF82_08725 [Patescibacteria group bacterium]|nr:hypothetical protein [Patescibacteria group bacterium]